MTSDFHSPSDRTSGKSSSDCLHDLTFPRLQTIHTQKTQKKSVFKERPLLCCRLFKEIDSFRRKHLHRSGADQAQMDPFNVSDDPPDILVNLRRALVADLLHARRPPTEPPPSRPEEDQLHAVHPRSVRLHVLLPLQHRNPAHRGLRNQSHDGRVSRGHLPQCLPVCLRHSYSRDHVGDCLR